jgi:enamine deaminase RidA (YjgF/YER057c/UK114 family)
MALKIERTQPEGMNVRMHHFGVAVPTSTTIQISRLAQPEAMVEIEMIAVV